MYVDPTTLCSLSAQARGNGSAQAQRQVLPKEQLTTENIARVTTLVLLRERAKTVRADYKRHWECLQGVKPDNFDCKSPEGDGDAADRQLRLRQYIDHHLVLIESYGKKIRVSESAMKLWEQANRSGGPRRKGWTRLNKAIADELSRREKEMSIAAQADAGVSAQAHKYQLQFTRDVERVERECPAEDISVQKPTVKYKMKAAITNAYNRGDLEEAKRRKDQLDRKFALERAKRRERKARKRRMQHCRVEMDTRPQVFEPNSDNEAMSSTFLSVYLGRFVNLA